MILNDYIEAYKLWQDNDLIQLRIVCSSTSITATSKIYVSDSLIDDLIHQIQQFLSGKVDESFWANGDRGDHSIACVSLRFLHKDKLGHVLIEVFMELDDGGDYSKHNCCFYIKTEIGLLTTFCEKLPLLKQKTSGIKLILNDSEAI